MSYLVTASGWVATTAAVLLGWPVTIPFESVSLRNAVAGFEYVQVVVYKADEPLLMVAVCTRPVMVVSTCALAARGPARRRVEERILMFVVCTED